MSAETQDLLDIAISKIQRDTKFLSSAQGAYQAFLGYYLGQMKRMKMKSKETLVWHANEFASQMGMTQVPSLGKNMVGKMGLKGVAGIVLKTASEEESDNQRRGGNGNAGKRGHNDGRKTPKPKQKRQRN